MSGLFPRARAGLSSLSYRRALVVGLLAAAASATFYLASSALLSRWVIGRVQSAIPSSAFSIESVDTNPIIGRVRLGGVRLEEPGGGDFIRSPGLTLNVGYLASLVSGRTVFRSVVLSEPEVVMRRLDSGAVPLLEQLRDARDPGSGIGDAAREAGILPKSLSVEGGFIRLRDEASGSVAVLDGLNLQGALSVAKHALTAEGGLREARIEAAAGERKLALRGVRFDAELARERLTLNALRARFNGIPVRASGTVRFGKVATLDLEVRAGVEWSRIPFMAWLDPVDGRVDLVAKATGPLGAPAVSGRLASDEGSLLRIPYERLSAAFESHGGRLVLKDVRLAAFGGRFRGGGEIAMSDRSIRLRLESGSIESTKVLEGLGAIPILRPAVERVADRVAAKGPRMLSGRIDVSSLEIGSPRPRGTLEFAFESERARGAPGRAVPRGEILLEGVLEFEIDTQNGEHSYKSTYLRLHTDEVSVRIGARRRP